MSDILIPSETAETMAKYVASADPVLAKQASLETAIPTAVDTLISRGLVLPDARAVKIAAFIADPATMLPEMAKLAAAPALGQAANPRSPAKPSQNAADAAYEAAMLS